jgi:acyl dehydratase
MATDSVMAATAQSSVGRKLKDKIAVVKDFAQRFFKPVFPGEKLRLVAEQTSSDETNTKNIKYVSSEIRRGDEVVGQAISTYFIVDKDKYLSQRT